MNKKEFIDAGWRYGLKICGNEHLTIVAVTERDVIFSDGNFLPLVNVHCKPVVFSLKDLTSHCILEDYDDGMPFIPIVELAKIAYPKSSITFEEGVCFVDSDLKYTFSFEDGDFKTTYLAGSDAAEVLHTPNQAKLFKQLLKWHFDLMETDEKVFVDRVYVSNPYYKK